MKDLLLLFTGLVGLWVGTEFVIRGATRIARSYQLSEFFVGLVILSIGSDLPELAVAVDAGLRNRMGMEASGVVIGGSIGSAFGQIGLVMAILGLTGYVAVSKRYIYRDGAILLGSIILLAFMAWDGRITRLDGAVLLIVYLMYLIVLFRTQRGAEPPTDISSNSSIKYWLGLIAGMTIVVMASDLTVNAATSLADRWNVQQTLVAIVLIGIGTSLPALSISISALLKKKSGMSVGNLIGSNILDMLVPIGLSATIADVVFERHLLFFDLPILFVLSLLVLGFFVWKRGLQRSEAFIVLAVYVSYIVFKVGV